MKIKMKAKPKKHSEVAYVLFYPKEKKFDVTTATYFRHDLVLKKRDWPNWYGGTKIAKVKITLV